MRVYQVENFLFKYLKRDMFNISSMPVSSLSAIFNIFIFIDFMRPENFLFLISFIFISTIVISYLTISLLISFKEVKRKKRLYTFLNNLKQHTLKTNDYKCVNFLILDKTFDLIKDDFKKAFQDNSINPEKLAYKGRILLN